MGSAQSLSESHVTVSRHAGIRYALDRVKTGHLEAYGAPPASEKQESEET